MLFVYWLLTLFPFLGWASNVFRWNRNYDNSISSRQTALALAVAVSLPYVLKVWEMMKAWREEQRLSHIAKDAEVRANFKFNADSRIWQDQQHQIKLKETRLRIEGYAAEEALRQRIAENARQAELQRARFLETIPDDTRYSGTWIIAPQGLGKTNLMWNLAYPEMNGTRTVVLMDSKGDFIRPFRNHPDAIVLDKDTVTINPFQFGSSTRSLNFLEYIFSALLDAKFTQLQTTLWRECLELLLRIPNATMETLRQLLVRGLTPAQKLIAESCNPATRDFFLEGPKPEFETKDYMTTRRGLLWRIRLLLSTEHSRRMFTAEKSSHDFLALLDSKKIIVIDNSKDDLGDEGAEFLGRFFVALVYLAATARSKLPDDKKIPVSFYIDECHVIIKRDERIRSIIQECRSQKIALTLAHQYMSDISTVAQPALFNCAVRIANADEEAPEIAPRLNVKDPNDIKLPPHNFMVFARGNAPTRITVPFLDLASIPQKPPPPPQPEAQTATPAPQPEPPKKKQKPFKKDRNPQGHQKKIW